VPDASIRSYEWHANQHLRSLGAARRQNEPLEVCAQPLELAWDCTRSSRRGENPLIDEEAKGHAEDKARLAIADAASWLSQWIGVGSTARLE
jgi:hypothetical protein